jgi:catechol 2,3-dioxygenase
MDAAVRFYSQVLGFRLTNRIGNRWSTIEAGPSYWTTDEVNAGLTIGLREATKEYPAPGVKGAVMFGLETYYPLEDLMARLQPQGVRFTSEIVRFDAGNSVSLEDPDGNPIYFHEFPPFMLEEEDRGEEDEDDGAPASLSGGHGTVFVSDMDRAVQWYRDVLGLKLTNRFGNHWATLEAGGKLVVGLHPQSPKFPVPGTRGAAVLSLESDEPLDRLVVRLAAKGVKVQGSVEKSGGKSLAGLCDADGNLLMLSGSETGTASPEPELAGRHSRL